MNSSPQNEPFAGTTESHPRYEDPYEDFFAHASVSFHWVGPDGTILRANRAELSLLGYTEEEFVGHHISEFHVDREIIEDILARLAQGETLHDYEARLRCKDGSVKWVSVDSTVRWGPAGEFLHTRCVTREITDRRRTDEAEVRLAAVVASSDDAIISKNLDGIVRSWNPGAERIFGYSAEEMIGQSIRRIIPANQQDEEDLVLSRIRAGERVDHFETVRVRKDGTLVPISLTVSPVHDRNGRVIGASKVARDITERKLNEAALRESMATKDLFLGLVSHELRTPVTVVMGNAQLLLRWSRLSDETRERSLADIITESKRLDQIIENLLAMTRLEKQAPSLEPVSLQGSVESALQAVRLRNRARTVVMDGSTDCQVLADEQLLHTVLENLLGNALKYSAPETPVEVTFIETEDQAEVHVLDRGIGVDPGFELKVFEPFFRTDSGRVTAGGLGLGLAVSKRAVEAMGGSIQVRKRPGGGSDFRFTLPIAPGRGTAFVREAAGL